MAKRKPAATTDDALLEEVRSRLRWSIDEDSDNRRDGLADLKFLLGGTNQWDGDAVDAREADGRPCHTVNLLPAFKRQIVNDMRQNRASIKVSPVDDVADPETAKVIQGIIKHIERNGGSEVACDTADDCAVSIGFGYYRICTDYTAADSFEQDIVFKRIRNPMSVYCGPHQEPDGSDMRWCVVSEETPRDEFERQYPGVDVGDLSALPAGAGDAVRIWTDNGCVRTAEYYRIEEESATLCMLSNGETGYKDRMLALPADVHVIKERSTDRRKVMWYKIAGGLKVVDSTEIPCDWIPVFPVYGEEIDVEGRVTRKGVVRDAKDPARMYNVWMSTATEQVGMIPKAPYIGAEGQFEGHEKKWATANRRSYSYLEYKPKSVGGQLAPAPQRQHMPDVPSGVLAMAAHARDDVKAVTGIFDASLGARGNETSGRAINARKQQGEVSNFHFVDNSNRTKRHAGRCLLSMIPRVYDTERVVRIIGDDDEPGRAEVNKPLPKPQVDEKTGAIRHVLNDLSVGRYDVAISTGPSYATQRQESVDAKMALAQSWPKLMDVAGDKVVKSMDWQDAEEIAERIERTIPPALRGEDGEEKPPIPPEVVQIVQQAQQHIQQLEQALKDAQSGAERERLKAESAERVAEINAANRLDQTELKGMIDMLIKQMQPPPALVSAALDMPPHGSQQEQQEQQEQQFAPQPGPAMDQAPGPFGS